MYIYIVITIRLKCNRRTENRRTENEHTVAAVCIRKLTCQGYTLCDVDIIGLDENIRGQRPSSVENL
jgi:hypothetical protein